MSQQNDRTLRNDEIADLETPRRRSASADSHHTGDTAESSPYPSLSPSSDSAELSTAVSNGGKGIKSGSRGDEPRTVASNTSAPQPPDVTPGSEQSAFSSVTDGLTDRLFRSKSKGPVAAIFIHAGAGFHSTSNEHVHLQACNDAARIAMKFLKAGGTAVDAVEVAIKSLEDKEITNAGYGSNLSIDGIVEGDATIVDHLGRSGACGAVSMVKNPISLARLILDRSNVPLSLRRIPPNILVGAGAKQFAEEYGMRLVPNEHMVSVSAGDRFYRWRQDLIRAETIAAKHRQAASSSSPRSTTQGKNTLKILFPSIPKLDPPRDSAARREHSSPVETSTWKETRHGSSIHYTSPDSNLASQGTTKREVAGPSKSSAAAAVQQQPTKQSATSSTTPANSASGTGVHTKGATVTAYNAASSSPPSPSADTSFCPPRTATPHPKRIRLGSGSHDESMQARGGGGNIIMSQMNSTSTATQPSAVPEQTVVEGDESSAEHGLHEAGTDMITDTVGAIAIDLRGNIAAGSSSGGIGMKHSGRIGPAALVGIGTAVMPADPKDDHGTSVAAVTSGTGEHMATTMASHTCAERLYYNQRRVEGGTYVSEYDEDAIMKAFVTDDFMNHPGVKNQISGGAIGVMAVKKTNKGIYFHFAHNTDSFALGSMASNEHDPLVVMSRMGHQEGVSSGGRKIKS